MLCESETTLGRDVLLTLFDFLIEKLFYQATIQTDQVVMMRAQIELEHRLAGLK